MVAQSDPYGRYLDEALAAYHQGDLQRAGQIWQAILRKVPGHPQALAGLQQIRAQIERQTQATVPEDPSPLPAASALPLPPQESDENVEEWIRSGCILYEMGQYEDALKKWELALAAQPSHANAYAYIQGLRKEMGLDPLPPQVFAKAQVQTIVTDSSESIEDQVDRLMREATQSFELEQHEAAIAAWEKVLRLDPNNQLALKYLELAWGELSAKNQPAAPQPLSQPGEDVERLMREAVQLYEMDQFESAVANWRKVLNLQPDHALARTYLDSALRELQQQAPIQLSATPSEPAQILPTKADTQPGIPPSFLDGMDPTLGTPTEISLDLRIPAPQESQAQEVGTTPRSLKEDFPFLSEEFGPETPDLPPPLLDSSSTVSMKALPPKDPLLENLLREAEADLHKGNYPEAAVSFQTILQRNPDHSRALEGLRRCHALQESRLTSESSAPKHPLPEDLRAYKVNVLQADARTQPPASITTRSGAPRTTPWVRKTQRNSIPYWPWIGLGAGLLVVALGAYWALGLRKGGSDGRLQEKARLIREKAVQEAASAQGGRIELALPGREALQQEAEQALRVDPLHAYFVTKSLLDKNPENAVAAKLMERAKAALQGMGEPPSADEYQRKVQAGDLAGARIVLDAMLAKDPENPNLRRRAEALYLHLAFQYAQREALNDSRGILLKGRAMFPENLQWQLRVQLLESIRFMDAEERQHWIPLL